MSQWGNNDNAANSVLWVGSSLNRPANTTIRNNAFGNTTPGAFVTNLTAGQFGVGAPEVSAARAGRDPRPAHAGWVLRTVGTGGRAGRVNQEVLVAMGSITGDAADDTVLPDFTILITSQPQNRTSNTTTNATFSVVANTVPAGQAVVYAWTLANGSAIPTNANVGPTNQANLVINTAVQTSNAAYRVTITGTGADPVVSANATLTIV